MYKKMAKSSDGVLISMAICILSFINFAYAAEKFNIVGKVFCDTCRVEFETILSEPMPGVLVKLECRHEPDGDTVSYSKEAVTNKTGIYNIEAEGDHAEEICEVSVVKSLRADCNEEMESRKRARVVLDSRDGLSEPTRKANNLGFMKKEAVPGCDEVLRRMGSLHN